MSDSKKTEKFTFSCEEDDKLIEAVASHPALYDLKHELYKDQRAKDNIWVIIGNAVGRSGKFINYILFFLTKKHEP